MLNMFTVCSRPETPGSYLCQQQAVAVHLHLHWAASHSPALDQAEHSREATRGINTENHSTIIFFCLTEYLIISFPFELHETLTIHLIPRCSGDSSRVPELHEVRSHLHRWLRHRHQGRPTQLLRARRCRPVHRVVTTNSTGVYYKPKLNFAFIAFQPSLTEVVCSLPHSESKT